MTTFELIQLPYAPDALEPVISAQTISFHYGKHLQAYVNNLNGLLAGSGFENATLEEIVCKSEGGIFNNAGQILNHNLYFTQFCAPQEDNQPVGELAEAIKVSSGHSMPFVRSSRRRVLHSSALVGYGCLLIRMINSSSHRRRMPAIH